MKLILLAEGVEEECHFCDEPAVQQMTEPDSCPGCGGVVYICAKHLAVHEQLDKLDGILNKVDGHDPEAIKHQLEMAGMTVTVEKVEFPPMENPPNWPFNTRFSKKPLN